MSTPRSYAGRTGAPVDRAVPSPARTTRIARYGKSRARPGHGEELARHVLAAADGLRQDPGRGLYLVSHHADDPDVVWVTELWRPIWRQ